MTAGGISVAPWVIAVALQRVDLALVLRSLRNGLVVAAVIGLGVGVLVAIGFNGATMFDNATVSLQGALLIGVVVGLLASGLYLWAGATVLAIVLILRARPAWASAGVWFTPPITLALVGFVLFQLSRPPDTSNLDVHYPGTISLSVSGVRLGMAMASGPARCTYTFDGAFSVVSGESTGQLLVAQDGRAVDAELGVDQSGKVGVQLVIGDAEAFPGKGWDPGPNTTALVAGWTRAGGSIQLTNLVPLTSGGEPDPTERWSGELGWTCAGP